MIYKNEDKSLVKVRIGRLAIGTSVVFHNDGMIEDVHIITLLEEHELSKTANGSHRIKTVVIADSTQDIKYPFFHDFDRECYILESTPSRHDLLFDED